MHRSVPYILAFAAAVCVVCGVLVSASAVVLQERQEANATVERKTNVLLAAGLITADEKPSAAEIEDRFAAVEAVVIDLRTGDEATGIEAATFDQRKAKTDPETSREAPPNRAGLKRVPNHGLVYRIAGNDDVIDMVVLPIEGVGLWSTLYGYVALEGDTTTVRGLTYYKHGETPGLGGEVDNRRWKALWTGRRAFDESWQPRIEVIKGQAGTPEESPYEVDGLSGATITSRAVTEMLRFWLGENGFGPFLAKVRATGRTS